MPIKTKFLSTEDVVRTVAEVAELAIASGARVALIGGVAMAVYGSDRLTKDVDFASTTTLPLRDPVKKLSFGGERGLSRDGVPIDVIVRDDDYAELYTGAIESARDEGLPVRVVTPEYLSALKLAAARDKDELDLKDLLKRGVVDRRLARQIVKNSLGEFAARAFDAIGDEVDWRESQGKRED